MFDFPFHYRILAAVSFLALASGIEFAMRGSAGRRWRASLVIIACGTIGAGFGVSVDYVTSSISPAYFAVGKGLGWEAGLWGRVCELGFQAGVSGGAVLGCVFAYFGYRAKWPVLPLGRVIGHARYPLVFAVVCGALLGGAATFAPNSVYPDSYLKAGLDEPQTEGVFVVWLAHIGIYLGALAGAVVGAVRITRQRAHSPHRLPK